MQRLDCTGLPDDPLAAAAAFYAEWTERAEAIPNPSLSGDECLVITFPSADHTHSAWRLAAVQGLARAHTPARVNAVAGGDEAAVAAALAYLAAAPGLTGQLLPLDSHGAAAVLLSRE